MNEATAGNEKLVSTTEAGEEAATDTCSCCTKSEKAEREQPAVKETVSVRTPYTQQFGSFS